MRQGWLCLVVVALGLSAGGCSVLIGDVAGAQCKEDLECTQKNLGDKCVHNVCVTTDAACSGDNCADAGTAYADGCKVDADCKSSSAPKCMRKVCVAADVAERFLCPQDPTAQISENVHYSVQVLEFVTRKPPQNLVVLACRGQDVTCADPQARFEDSAGTGLVEFDLPFGFLGFFEVKSSNALDALQYLTRPLTSDTRDRDLQVASATTVNALATVAGVPFDPSKGIAMVEAFDCKRVPQGGIHFIESKGGSDFFYLVNHIPNNSTMVSVYDELNNVADGGFVNVLPGFVTFSAQLGVDGPILGEFNAAVRPSTVTYIDMYF